MRSLLLITTLLFSALMFSSPSYAKWEKMEQKVDGTTYYVDFERIRKVDGYVCWWDLLHFPKLNKQGSLSAKGCSQGDCKSFRYKGLSWSFHKKNRWEKKLVRRIITLIKNGGILFLTQ
jgi:hypothetical protein